MNAVFAELARRIEMMRPNGTEQGVIYNFLFGSLYALAQAEALGFPMQGTHPGKSSRRSDEVRRLAGEMARGECLPQAEDLEWLNGYYFNDALFRLGVCLEHLLRYYTGLQGREQFPALIKKAADYGFEVGLMVPGWADIKDEVDAFRHRGFSYGEGPKTTYAQALTAIQHLVGAVEWAFQNLPNKP
jgi:hypothetical protein